MPVEQEFEERILVPETEDKLYGVIYYGCFLNLAAVTCVREFLGIIYQKDGVETLRTSIDAAFGTPVRVRFAK